MHTECQNIFIVEVVSLILDKLRNETSRTKRADLFIVCYRSAGTSVADLQKIYR